MSVLDILEKICVPLIAAFVGAVLAFRYQRTIELRREKRVIIQTLMMYRNVGAYELDYIKAINIIDIVFHKDRRVIELYHTLLAQLRPPLFENRQWVETFFQLVHEMAQCSDYTNLTMQDIRDFYSPDALIFHYPNRNVTAAPLAPETSSNDKPQTK